MLLQSLASRLPSLGRIGPVVILLFPWLFAFFLPESVYRLSIVHVLGLLVSAPCLVYTAGFVEILVHECGHWLVGRAVGIKIERLVVGTGEPWFEFTLGGIRFSFRQWMYSGYVQDPPSRRAIQFWPFALYCSGGMLFVAVLLVGAWFLPEAAAGTRFHTHLHMLKFMLPAVGLGGIWASIIPAIVWVDGRYTPNDAMLIAQAWKRRHRAEEEWQKQLWWTEVYQRMDEAKFEEARSLLEKRLEADPTDEDVRGMLSNALYELGEFERSFQIVETLAQARPADSPERAEIFDSAATAALQTGRRDLIEKVRPWVEEAFKTAPTPTIAGTLGSVLVELGDLKNGVKHLNQCLAETDEDHDLAIANAYLAKAARQLKNEVRAKELLELAKKLGGGHPLVGRLVTELEGPRASAEPTP